MRQERFYKILIFLLLLLNFGMLGYLLVEHKRPTPPPHGRPAPPDRIIIERLQLNDEQQSQFDVLKHEHHTQMVAITERSAELHKQLFT